MLAARPIVLTLVSAACISAGSGCGGDASTQGGLRVVAAEGFWGSIARQLAGNRAEVQSIIVNPAADPHSYEPTAADGITLARSSLAVVNGLGYDRWASQLLAANPDGNRVVLDVGKLLGLREGDNPHQWYSPDAVLAVARRITQALQKLDPRDSAYFADRRDAFLNSALAPYRRLIAAIRAHYRGVSVGYSETIVAPLGRALGLRLATPYGFAKAISEGGEVTAADRTAVEAQARRHEISVWVFNSQNTTPDVQRVNDLVRAAGIPVVRVTETLSPAGSTFQAWQAGQLRQLAGALRSVTGR